MVHILNMNKYTLLSIAVRDQAAGWIQTASKVLNSPFQWSKDSSMLTVFSFGSNEAFVQMTDGQVFPFDPEENDFKIEGLANAGTWGPRKYTRCFGMSVARELFPDCI